LAEKSIRQVWRIRNSPKGAELANINLFHESKRLASEIVRSDRHTDDELAAMTLEQRAHVAELRAQLESYRARFYAQFNKPDPEAPFKSNRNQVLQNFAADNTSNWITSSKPSYVSSSSINNNN